LETSFRNTKGGAWTTDAVNCAFSSIQIRLGRRLLDQRTRQVDKPADKRRKYSVDDAVLIEIFAGKDSVLSQPLLQFIGNHTPGCRSHNRMLYSRRVLISTALITVRGMKDGKLS
jgi:hypothetical protein